MLCEFKQNLNFLCLEGKKEGKRVQIEIDEKPDLDQLANKKEWKVIL